MTPRRLACSGTVDPHPLLPELYQDSFLEYEYWYGEPNTIVSGCAPGVDSDWIEFAAMHWPDSAIELVVPAAPHNQRLVEHFRRRYRARVTIKRMPARPGWSNSEIYMERNGELQHRADVLFAFPSQPREVLRSGTWATVRRFKKVGKPIYVEHVDLKEGYWL